MNLSQYNPRPAAMAAHIVLFREAFSGLCALVAPIAPLVVGSREFVSRSDGTINGHGTMRGVLLDRHDAYIAALLPRGICIAKVSHGAHGRWTSCGFEPADASEFSLAHRGDRVLRHLCEALHGIPMRREAWRRQRIVAMERAYYEAKRQSL